MMMTDDDLLTDTRKYFLVIDWLLCETAH